MNRVSLVLTAGLAAFVALASLVAAQEKQEKKPAPVTITGTLVDTKCYAMDSENFTNDHGDIKACGTACANMSIPVGIVKDGKKGDPAVILLAPSKSFADHVGRTVRATGTYVWKNAAFLPEKAEYRDDKGNWSEIKIKTMM